MCDFQALPSFFLLSVFVSMLCFCPRMASICQLVDLWFECRSVPPSVFSLCLCVCYCSVTTESCRCCGLACLCLCLWCCVLWHLCISCVVCCACPLSGSVCPNSLGYVCHQCYCTSPTDDLESILIRRRRDHLSAIKLLGNLFQTTLAAGDFPSNPFSALAVMSIS